MRGGFGGPGGDLLFRALRRSTIGAEGFHGRVRDGIGCYAPRYGHQALPEVGDQRSEIGGLSPGLDPVPHPDRAKRVVWVFWVRAAALAFVEAGLRLLGS